MDVILFVLFCCTFLGLIAVTCLIAGVAAMAIGGGSK